MTLPAKSSLDSTEEHQEVLPANNPDHEGDRAPSITPKDRFKELKFVLRFSLIAVVSIYAVDIILRSIFTSLEMDYHENALGFNTVTSLLGHVVTGIVGAIIGSSYGRRQEK